MYIAPAQAVGNREGQFFFMRREERTQEQAKKPSIKEQLAVKPVPGDRPTKPKDREVR